MRRCNSNPIYIGDKPLQDASVSFECGGSPKEYDHCLCWWLLRGEGGDADRDVSAAVVLVFQCLLPVGFLRSCTSFRPQCDTTRTCCCYKPKHSGNTARSIQRHFRFEKASGKTCDCTWFRIIFSTNIRLCMFLERSTCCCFSRKYRRFSWYHQVRLTLFLKTLRIWRHTRRISWIFSFFNQLIPVLKNDSTLFLASAFNSQSFEGTTTNATLVHRYAP